MKCKPVAVKAGRLLWDHFVHADDTATGTTFKSRPYRLKPTAVGPALSTHLHLFVTSILISTQMGFTQSGLTADQLSPDPQQDQLLPSQRQRLQLVRRLLVGVEVAGILNNAQLCLQMVVKCYGLLAPLIQHRVSSRATVEMLLHCQAVLLELPEGLLSSNKSHAVTAALHHMIAAIAYYVGKVRY